MSSRYPTDLLRPDPDSIHIWREISRSQTSSVFEIELHGNQYAMKLFHDNGDPGFTNKGRDLNRFRCELNAYRNLHAFGVCERGFVPRYHGYIDRLEIRAPQLNAFANDRYRPRAILLEYLSGAEALNCVNYSTHRFRKVMIGMKAIHSALIHHNDIYPKNILIVPSTPERVVWIDFDVATTFPHRESMGCQEVKYCDYEDALVASFGELLQDDQNQGLPPNTKYY
ncbi:hypothetical protein ACJ73_09400 [Blastomyces percursus]|uniref:Protein kinase domain-containing protein n=1 Tax=Blastomyces percursus TaxID=1658174 RepID=A0A1J9Q7J3_9EURO|nr:hypothetical protein ACJ73_09400 [Blastomyces percursus]